MRKWSAFILVLVIFSLALPAGRNFAGERLRLATTTSTDNSGLLKVLNPPFEKMFGVSVDVIAVGTGKALALGRNGDADVILVHAQEAEKDFVANGYGVNRREVMYNDFVVLGPKADPAGIMGEKNARKALKMVAATGSPFISRGDDSGTHMKERSLWAKAGISPSGGWYLAVGQGMGASLTIADEKRAYVLTDRGTYLAYKKKIDLVVLVEGDADLFNPYGVIAVNPARWPRVNYTLAMAYIGWLTSPRGQKIIEGFTIGGEPLFLPIAISAGVGKKKTSKVLSRFKRA